MELNTKQKRKQEFKLQSIYSRGLLSRKVTLPINFIGKNIDELLEEYIKYNFEGKCSVEGYIKQNSSKIITYSCGTIERGNLITFEVIFECEICLPVEGMLINCIAKNITKAGIRAESIDDIPSPFIVFIAKDHHYNSQQFNNVQIGDKIIVRVIGQRFELNDKYISIIGELTIDKSLRIQKKNIATPKQYKKPKLIIEN